MQCLLRWVWPILIAAQVGATSPSIHDGDVQEVLGASISGLVEARRDGELSPVRRARVALRSGSSVAQITESDTEGRFRFRDLAAGSHFIEVTKAGFVHANGGSLVRVLAGQNAGIRIELTAGAAIEGSVLLPSGRPAKDATVSVAASSSSATTERRPVAFRQTKADDSGSFRIHSLPAGSYVVYSSFAPFELLNIPAQAESRRVLQTYFPGTERMDLAASVSVRAGDEVRITLAMVPGALTTAAGHVLTSSGRPPSTMSVAITRIDGLSSGVACSWIGAQFECPNLPPGDFRLLVSAQPTDNGISEFAVVPLAAPVAPAMSALAISTEPGAVVVGRVEWRGRVPVDVIAVEAGYAMPPANPTDRDRVRPNVVRTDSDGAFRFQSLFGPRLFRPQSLPPDWAVLEVSLNGVTITDVPTEFRYGHEPLNLIVILTSETGSVSGTVSTPVSAARGPLRVVAFGEDRRYWARHSRFVRLGDVDSEGVFGIQGLLPGQYYLAVMEAVDGDPADAGVLAQLMTRAVPFTVKAAQNVTIDFGGGTEQLRRASSGKVISTR